MIIVVAEILDIILLPKFQITKMVIVKIFYINTFMTCWNDIFVHYICVACKMGRIHEVFLDLEM